MLSRAWHRSHAFPRLVPVTCFPVVGTGHMFSRAWHRSHAFLRLAPVTRFPALDTILVFSCPCPVNFPETVLQISPRFTPVSCFPALVLQIFLNYFANFPAIGTGCMCFVSSSVPFSVTRSLNLCIWYYHSLSKAFLHQISVVHYLKKSFRHNSVLSFRVFGFPPAIIAIKYNKEKTSKCNCVVTELQNKKQFY